MDTRSASPKVTARIELSAQGAQAASPVTMPADLLQKNSCTACHAADRKLVGPSWTEVAKKHPGRGDYLAAKIRAGGSGTWGNVPMPPQAISAEEAVRIAEWLASGAAP
jgi:cytochrome c